MMKAKVTTVSFLAQETKALLTRLKSVRPFALTMPMVSAASIPRKAQQAIEQHVEKNKTELSEKIHFFLRWLSSPKGRYAAPDRAQRLFSLIKLQFNSILDQVDIFADVLTQRSEHETGVWMAGLDYVAAEALKLPDGHFGSPPVICYLDRGHGAAIQRARTRLPGGKKNPVAIIRVPRERMVGSGIASSLVHEVGHQGAALLNLVNSLRHALIGKQANSSEYRLAWALWERWISEIIADLWAIGKLGVVATLGLMGVVSLPRWFVFRINIDDPHPFPWIRVKLSCAIGRALYPDRQWDKLARLWDKLYPIDSLDDDRKRIVELLEAHLPTFANFLVNYRSGKLRGKSLKQAFPIAERQPRKLRAIFESWRLSPERMAKATPTLVFAVLGQAKADRNIVPEEESQILGGLLTFWAWCCQNNISPGHELSVGKYQLNPHFAPKTGKRGKLRVI